MAKLRRKVIYTTVRWEETGPLTDEQIENWKTEDENLQDIIMDELEFELSHDKVIDDYEWPELIEEE